MSWSRVAPWSAAAAAVAMLLMFLARTAFQVRTLPERLVEWVLLFVPLDAFEASIRIFGPKAKVYALDGAVVTMTLGLWAIGALALRRRWSPGALLALGVGLFLVATAVIMPLTGAGFFATGLLQSPWLVNAVYLGTSLAYVSVLLAARVLEPAPAVSAGAPGLPAPAGLGARRALLGTLIGTAGAFLVAWRQNAAGGAGGSTLPLAQLPPPGAAPAGETGGVAGPSPVATPAGHPDLSALLATPTAEAGSGTTAPPAAAAAPTLTAPAEPTPESRDLPRDQNGALEASGRAPGQLAELITPPGDHYVVTKNAGGDPVLDAASWRLILDGEVQRPVQVDFATLQALPAVQLTKTLECISNLTSMCSLASFGCDLISTAMWKGARLSDVLNLAGGLNAGVVSLEVQGADEFTSSIPASLALDPNALLAYEMNGQPLPREHGYPVRLLVPGRYGMKNAKWVIGIRALRYEFVDWYGQRNWNRQGVVKTMSRIDVPADGATVPAGRQRIAGIAYAGDRGINGVQFSSDGGRTWNPADFIEPAPGRDAWVRWEAAFDVAAGQQLTLTVRAYDGQGQVQTDVFQLPQPNGGSGLHSIQVTGG